MKILYTNFHHRNGGGHVTYIMNLVRALSSEHSISVATPGTSRLYAQANAEGTVRTYDMRFTSRIGPMISEVRTLRRLIQQEQFDIIHVNASADHRHIMLATLGLRNRPKIVWTKHNDHSVGSVGHKLRARFGTDAVIAVSAYVQSMLNDSPYFACPTYVIRHGVDTNEFKPVSVDEKQTLRLHLLGDSGAGQVVFGSSGGTDYEKGWLDLVRAVATLPDPLRKKVRIVVAGDPPKQAYRDIVDDLGMTSTLVFPGLVSNVRDVLGACDVGFVLSYREALSFACRETMSMGLPTLVSSAGGLPENVNSGENGWVVPVADVPAIAQCVRGILEEESRLGIMGAQARATSEADFGLDLFAARTLDVYTACLIASET